MDISEANLLKINGSIIRYGHDVQPEMMGAQADSVCSAPAQELYAGLDEGQQKRAQLAEDYLRDLVNTHVETEY